MKLIQVIFIIVNAHLKLQIIIFNSKYRPDFIHAHKINFVENYWLILETGVCVHLKDLLPRNDQNLRTNDLSGSEVFTTCLLVF